jgi:hypothetical protein
MDSKQLILLSNAYIDDGKEIESNMLCAAQEYIESTLLKLRASPNKFKAACRAFAETDEDRLFGVVTKCESDSAKKYKKYIDENGNEGDEISYLNCIWAYALLNNVEKGNRDYVELALAFVDINVRGL